MKYCKTERNIQGQRRQQKLTDTRKEKPGREDEIEQTHKLKEKKDNSKKKEINRD